MGGGGSGGGGAAAEAAAAAARTQQFKLDIQKKIRDEKKQEAAKKLQSHFKYVHLGLKTRCFSGWANHIRDNQVKNLEMTIAKEQDKARGAGKSHGAQAKAMQGALDREKEIQEEGKVRYYQASVRRSALRSKFSVWVGMLYLRRIAKVESLLELEFDQRQQMEREKRELENELEEVYLGKARAEAEREECMAALRQHREKEEMDMNRLLEEVGYLKAEVYAS